MQLKKAATNYNLYLKLFQMHGNHYLNDSKRNI